MQGIRLCLYDGFGSLMASLMGTKRAKYFFEAMYWQFQWVRGGGKLPNAHYQAAFTDGFGLEPSYFAEKKVLDIGCGPRGSLEWAPDTSICYGLDPLADQYLKLNKGRHRMTYVNAPAEAIPFASDYFDMVSSLNSLDHVDDLEQVLKEVHRVLKPGGDFLLLADVHDKPALCEPVVLGWDLPERLSSAFEVIFVKQLKRNKKIFQSLREAAPYADGAYGLLVAHFVKK